MGLVPWAGKAVYVGGGVVQVVTVPWGWYLVGTVGVGGQGGAVGGGAVQVVAVPWGWYCGTAVVYGDGVVLLCWAVPCVIR